MSTLHTSGPQPPLTWRQALAALEALPMDTVVARHPHSGRVVTTGELQAQLVYGEITAGTVGALLVLRGLPVRGDAA